MNEINDLLKKVLVFIGDINRMDIRMNTLREEAKKLGVNISDLEESEKTLCQQRKEANEVYNCLDKKLDGE